MPVEDRHDSVKLLLHARLLLHVANLSIKIYTDPNDGDPSCFAGRDRLFIGRPRESADLNSFLAQDPGCFGEIAFDIVGLYLKSRSDRQFNPTEPEVFDKFTQLAERFIPPGLGENGVINFQTHFCVLSFLGTYVRRKQEVCRRFNKNGGLLFYFEIGNSGDGKV